MKKLLEDIGTMRILLLLVLLPCLPMAVYADAEPVGFGVVTAYIAPSLVVLFFFVLLLDALMNRVFSIEQEEDVRKLHRLRIRTDLLGVAAVLLSWGPFFYNLLSS